jgi:hypothetical protein
MNNLNFNIYHLIKHCSFKHAYSDVINCSQCTSDGKKCDIRMMHVNAVPSHYYH